VSDTRNHLQCDPKVWQASDNMFDFPLGIIYISIRWSPSMGTAPFRPWCYSYPLDLASIFPIMTTFLK
jgi:hypothetical protein